MDFEYGCATVNKFAFLDENEVEDPSDLLAQVSLAKEAATKKPVGKVDPKAKKVDPKKAPAKDANKKPLQPSDNAKKTENKDSGLLLIFNSSISNIYFLCKLSKKKFFLNLLYVLL